MKDQRTPEEWMREHVRCVTCCESIPLTRVLFRHQSVTSIAHCAQCGTQIRLDLPKIDRKLIYLDQSFFSDAARETGPAAKIFPRLRELQAEQKVSLIGSNIHALETANIPEERAENRQKLWREAISEVDELVDVAQISKAQLLRKIINPTGPDVFPLDDAGIGHLKYFRVGMNVRTSKNMHLRLAEAFPRKPEAENESFRQILIRQASQLSAQPKFEDCFDLVCELFKSELLSGLDELVAGEIYSRELDQALEKLVRNEGVELPKPPRVGSGFGPFVRDVLEELEEGISADKWRQLLNQGREWIWPEMELGLAIEAANLQRWVSGQQPKKMGSFHRSYGFSRQQDVQHLTVLPYVHALTVDDSTRALCSVPGVSKILGRHKCTLYSTSNLNQFEQWISELEATPLFLQED